LKQQRSVGTAGLTDLNRQPAKVEKMIAQADSEFEEVRINFRWGHSQLNTIKKAVDLIGVPYQTYIKSVLFRQATEDIRNFSTPETLSKAVPAKVRKTAASKKQVTPAAARGQKLAPKMTTKEKGK
jgi:predicted DNA binding CopG/RHH family protein